MKRLFNFIKILIYFIFAKDYPRGRIIEYNKYNINPYPLYYWYR